MRVTVAVAVSLGSAGCHGLAAMGWVGVVETPCDPDTFVNRCADPRTTVNCTRARDGLGLGSEGRAVVQSPCFGDNVCVVLDGWAECVAAPVTTCDADAAFSRCRDGRVEQCRPLTVWRGFERRDGELAAWVSVPEPCAEPPLP